MTTEIKNRIETIVKKYRDYVKANCREDSHPIWTSEDGDMEYVMIPDPYDSAADIQIIATLYSEVVNQDADERIKSALIDYSKSFKHAALDDEEFQFLCNYYAEFIEYVFVNSIQLNSFKSNLHAIDDDKEYLGFCKHILAKELQRQVPGSVYIAMAGLCDLAFCFPKDTIIYGCTHDFDTEPDEEWALCQIRLQAAGYRSEISPSFSPTENLYDFICGHERFERTTELFHLLSKKGKMLLVVKDFDLAVQQKIYDFVNRNHSLKSVIYRKFKADDFWGSNVGYLFISIDRQGADTVLMRYDNIDKECRVDYKDLVSNMLLPTYYLTPKPQNGIPLSEIADLVTDKNAGSLTEVADDADVIDVLETKFHKIVSPVNNSHHVSDYRKDEKDWALSPIKQPCVLFRGFDDAYGLKVVKEIPEFGYATKGGYAQFVPKDGYDLYYLAATLLRPEVKSQIMGFCDGIALGYYIEHFLDYILVPDFSPEERAEFVSETAIQAIEASNNEMQQNLKDYEKGVRLRKHALSQSLSAIDATLNVLHGHLVEKEELKAEDIISRITNRTVSDAFDFILKKMLDVKTLTEHLANVEYDFGDPEWVNPYRFISEFIDKYKSSTINYKLINSSENNKDILIYFPKKALEKIFKNIISNAQSHGFTDESRTDYCIDFSWEMRRDDLISIIVKNNGNPLANGINKSNIFEYGKSSCLNVNHHNGIGCHVIKYIMEKYVGDVRVLSTPDCKYTVTYILSFNYIEMDNENGKNRRGQ